MKVDAPVVMELLSFAEPRPAAGSFVGDAALRQRVRDLRRPSHGHVTLIEGRNGRNWVDAERSGATKSPA